MWRHLCDNLEPMRRIEYPYYGVTGPRVPASDILVWRDGFPEADKAMPSTSSSTITQWKRRKAILFSSPIRMIC